MRQRILKVLRDLKVQKLLILIVLVVTVVQHLVMSDSLPESFLFPNSSGLCPTSCNN